MEKRTLKIVFAGDITAGAPILKKIEAKAELCGVFALEPERIKDSGKLFVSNVKEINSPKNLNLLEKLSPDLIINFNSTEIFSERLLEIPSIGAVNFHPGPLPEYAGLYVYQWAIINGEEKYGITIHTMEKSIDTGKILEEERFEIKPYDTGLTLYMRTLNKGCMLLEKFIDKVAVSRKLDGKEQDLSKRGYYGKNALKSGRIDFNKTPEQIVNFVRALSYRPFKSPTYPPIISLDGKEIEVTKVEIVSNTILSRCPGTIINVDKNKITVTTQKGEINLETSQM